MDTLTITIVIAITVFAIGIALGWIFGGNRRRAEKPNIEPTNGNQDEKYKEVLSEKDEKIRLANKELEDIRHNVEVLKQKNIAISQEKEAQIKAMEIQLQSAAKGKIDDVIKEKQESLAKFQKKTKDLEDEIDDLEDEIDNYKKKLRNKDSELTIAQDELDKVTRESKDIKDELQQTRESLKNKSEELDIKIEGLRFVQEILLAQTADNDEDKRLGRKVEELRDFIRNDFKDAYKDIQNAINKKTDVDIFGNSLDSWAATAKKSWLSGKTTIALVGEFSAGKTSIVNRILSQDDPSVPRLPVSTKAATAIPTYISGAEVSSYRFVTPDDEIKSLSEDTFKKVNKEVLDQIKGISSLIKYFVMRYKNKNLTNLSILDTPGFNSNDMEDSERTIEVINECDALFWVFDINNGTINRSSIELIKNNLHRPLFVVINKVDSKSNVEVNQVESLIKKTLEDEGVPVVDYIRFSKKAPLKNIMSPIMKINHDADKDHYIENVLDEANRLLKEQESIVKRAHSKALNLQDKSNRLETDFEHSLGALTDDCSKAHDIPHWETHLFGKDKFEMTAEEFEEFERSLSNILDKHPQALSNLYNEQIQTVAELVETWKEEVEEKSKYQHLHKSISTLNKLTNNIKHKSSSI